MFDPELVFIPVDFSRSSRACIELARGLGAQPPRMQLAHVVDRWPRYMHEVLFPYAALGSEEVEFEVELIEHATAHLRSELELERFDDDERVEFSAPRVGRVYTVLPQMLASSSAQMVVMGAFGESGPMPGALGSVAARMARTSTRPILLVRALSQRQPSIRKIVCALDLGARASDVMEVAMGLALRCEAELETLFMLPDPLAHDPHGMLAHHVRFDAKQVLERERHKIEALFERAVKGMEVPFPQRDKVSALARRRKILVGDVAPTILDHVDAVDADLLILGTRTDPQSSRAGLGSTSWTVTRCATTHVLLVPIIGRAALLDR